MENGSIHDEIIKYFNIKEAKIEVIYPILKESNLGFILGGVALVSSLPTTRKLVRRDGGMLIGATVLLLIMLADLHMSMWEGIILVTVLVSYVGYLLYIKDGGDSAEEIPTDEFKWTDVLLLVGGSVLIITSGHYLVDAASAIARTFGLSEWVIGVTIVAAGTSA